METVTTTSAELQQLISSRAERTQWPIEVKQRARHFVVKLGWTITATAEQLGLPNSTCRQWAEEEDWLNLKRRAAQRGLRQLVAEVDAPVVVVQAPQVEPVQVGTQSRIDATLAQIDRIDRRLKTEQLTPRQEVELINAKATLWALVHPKAGTMKPSRRRSGQQSAAPMADIAPLDEGLDQPETPQQVVGPSHVTDHSA